MSFSRITAASVETSKVLETSLTSLARLTRFSYRELRGYLFATSCTAHLGMRMAEEK